MSANGRVRAVARVEVTLKPGIADPQGQTVHRALPALGWDNVGSVRVGKHIVIELEGESLEEIRAQVDEMCERFLTNPVLETFEVSVEEA